METDENNAEQIGPRIANVRERIALAAARAGKSASDIKLVAVSKTKPAGDVLEAYNGGLLAFGENYAQELAEKQNSEILRGLSDIEWHMIGHVQTNKVKLLIGNTTLIHSLDSVRLAEQIQKQAEKIDVIVDILIEINVAREPNKFGFFIEDAQNAIETIARYENIRIKGVMTSAPLSASPETNRPIFRELRKFFLDMANKRIHNTHMQILSMGMSGDFEVAVEEGSNLLRIGTLIFGRRNS